jgi:hypothetical protein
MKNLFISCLLLFCGSYSFPQSIYNDGAHIVSTTGNYWVINNGDFSLIADNSSNTTAFDRFVIEDQATLELMDATGLVVNDSLILKNNLDLNGQTLKLGSNGILVESTGMLIGTTGSITTTRNLSNIDENVAGLGAHIATNQNMGSTIITRYVGPCSVGENTSICRYYDIFPTINENLNATLTLNYFDCELNSNSESGLKLMRSTDLGQNWTDEGGSLNTTNNTISMSGIDAFSRWTATSVIGVLPVEYLDFKAKCIDNKLIEVMWTTASEKNNAYFDLEHSSDAQQFETVTSISGAIQSNQILAYKHIYNKDKDTKHYFRLKQVDIDGSMSYSKIINANCELDKLEAIFYPNPILGDVLYIDFREFFSEIDVEIYNANSELIRKTKHAQKSRIEISTIDWASGFYFIKVIANGSTLTQKIIKK